MQLPSFASGRPDRAFPPGGRMAFLLLGALLGSRPAAAEPCGDYTCNGSENRCNCPVDCPAQDCNDGCCLYNWPNDQETCGICPDDCACPPGQVCVEAFPGIFRCDLFNNGQSDPGETNCMCPVDC